MNRRGAQVVVIVAVSLGLAALAGWVLFLDDTTPAGPPIDITIDPGHQAASTLLLVAKEQGYFQKNGLNVTFVETPSAAVAVQNLLSGTTDIGFLNDYILSSPQLYHQPVNVLATLSESDTNFVVARRDHGILNVSDLQGKRIGVTQGSVGEYFLDRFFVINSIPFDNTTVVDYPASELVSALQRGEIDASFSPEPYVYRMRQVLGDNAVVWPANLGQHQFYSLVVTDTTLQQHPEIVDRLLRSVLLAQEYIRAHPDEAKAIAMSQTRFDPAYTEQDWKNHHFSVSLSQSLVTVMEEETRWRQRNNLSNITGMPDFAGYVDPGPLMRLKPSAVTIRQ